MTARDALDRALVDLAARNRRPRCADPDTWSWWTSDKGAERAAAARLCTGCPVLEPCRDAAQEAGEIFVWAGVDHGTSPIKRKANAKGAA